MDLRWYKCRMVSYDDDDDDGNQNFRSGVWDGNLDGRVNYSAGLTWYKGRVVDFHDGIEISGQMFWTEIWVEWSVIRWV